MRKVARGADAVVPGRAALHRYSAYEAQYFHQFVQSHLDRNGVKPEIVHYVPQIHTMLALVDAGVGVALTPGNFHAPALRRCAASPRQDKSRAFRWKWFISYRKDNDNPILNTFSPRGYGSAEKAQECGAVSLSLINSCRTNTNTIQFKNQSSHCLI
jgi:DNA-binding transcriptional LysR family regulator